MNDNALFRLEDLNALKRCVPDLAALNLRGNAVSDNGAYRGLVLRRLLSLESLDGVPVTERDREAAAESSSALNAATIREGSTFKRAENEYARVERARARGAPLEPRTRRARRRRRRRRTRGGLAWTNSRSSGATCGG